MHYRPQKGMKKTWGFDFVEPSGVHAHQPSGS